ncbi:MAG: DUF1996 domain-containing protein [Acidimicrobiia bacterium]
MNENTTFPKLISGIAVVAAIATAIFGVTTRNDPPDSLFVGKAPAAAKPALANPARFRGPQGRVGQFVVKCTYSHSGPFDPIVHPNMPGMSHRHDFYGAPSTDASTKAADLIGGKTTCNKSPDTAAYWQPTLYDHDTAVVPDSIYAYYRAAPGVDPKSLATMPTGLALIAGDATATKPQPGEASGWTCGSRSGISDEVPRCPAQAPLHLILTFQDCWDGKHLEAEDFRAHAAYSRDGQCPETHPVHIPQLMVSVKFPIFGAGHELRLASGNMYSAHGDFLNGWDPKGLQREIDACLKTGQICDLASNRGEEYLFTG